MLQSMLLTYLTVILTALIVVVWLLDESGYRETQSDKTLSNIMSEAVDPPGSAAARGNPIKDMNPVFGKRRGNPFSLFRFLGHNNLNIRVVRDEFAGFNYSILPPSREPAEDDALSPVMIADFAYESEDGLTLYSAGVGGSDIFGLGDNTFGLPNGLAIPSRVRLPFGRGDRLNRPKDGPVFLGLAIPAFPSEARLSDTGRVVVDVTVDAKGYVSYNILSVSPQFRGFGHAVERAILRGKYAPRIVNGFPVEHTTRLTLVLGYNQDPHAEESTAEFDAQTPDVNAVWLRGR